VIPCRTPFQQAAFSSVPGFDPDRSLPAFHPEYRTSSILSAQRSQRPVRVCDHPQATARRPYKGEAVCAFAGSCDFEYAFGLP